MRNALGRWMLILAALLVLALGIWLSNGAPSLSTGPTKSPSASETLDEDPHSGQVGTSAHNRNPIPAGSENQAPPSPASSELAETPERLTFVVAGTLVTGLAPRQNIDWNSADLTIEGYGLYNVEVDWSTRFVVNKSGAFELRATVQTLASSLTQDPDTVAGALLDAWAGLRLTVSHPLLRSTSVELAFHPIDGKLMATGSHECPMDAGTITLDAATGVHGVIHSGASDGAQSTAIGLYYLGSGSTPTNSEDAFTRCDGMGEFFLHVERAGTALLIVSHVRRLPHSVVVDIPEDEVIDIGVVDLSEGMNISGLIQPLGQAPAENYEVYFDGFDPPLKNTAEHTWRSMLMIPTREAFAWNEEEVCRTRCWASVGQDGRFSADGLSSRCYRLRPQLTVRTADRTIIGSQHDLWQSACAPDEGVQLTPQTSLLRMRIVDKSTGQPFQRPRTGSLEIIFDQERPNPSRLTLTFQNETTIECRALQAMDITLGQQREIKHRVIAPKPGEELLLTFEL